MASPARPPSSGFRSPLPPEAPQESALSRVRFPELYPKIVYLTVEQLLIAPLTFISFLLSLALIDSRNHSLRTHSHSPSRPQPSSFLGHLKSFLHSLIYKPAASSPYAYIKSPNKEKDGKGNGGKGEKGTEEEPWLRDAAVAAMYGSYLGTVLQDPAVIAVLTWGITDKYTWLNGEDARMDGEKERPLPFDAAMQPVAAYGAEVKALAGAPARG